MNPRTITRNALWSWAGLATGMLTGFIVAPYLVHKLGQATYGLWVLVLSVTSTISLMDFGLRAAIGRHVSLYRAKGELENVRAILGTARAILLIAAAAVIVITLALQFLFLHVFDVPPHQVASVRLSLMLVGISVAVTLALGANDATLWALHRFDLVNAIEMIAALIQASGSIYFASRGHGVLALTGSMAAAMLFREMAKTIACHILTRDCGFAPSSRNWTAAKKLFRYACWSSLWGIGQRLGAQAIPMVVGARISLSSVTPYNVASSLTTYARGFLSAGTGVMGPIANVLHARQDRAQQQRLFVEGSRYSWALSLMLVIGMLLLGRACVRLWMGPALADAARLLAILALGEALPMSQGIACALISSMNRHKVLGITSLIEASVVIALAAVMAATVGLWGVCIAVAVCGFVCRGVVPMLFVCRLLGLSLREYVMQALVPPIVVAILPTIALALLMRHRPPATWLEFLLYAAGFSVAFISLCGLRLRRGWRPADVIPSSGDSALAPS